MPVGLYSTLELAIEQHIVVDALFVGYVQQFLACYESSFHWRTCNLASWLRATLTATPSFLTGDVLTVGDEQSII